MAKNLYHTHLKEMGNPVRVTVTSDPLKSKYPKEGVPNKFVGMKIAGVDYSYTCESDQCVQALTGLKGKEVMLSVEGSRGDATITVVGQPGTSVAQPQQRQQAPPQHDEPMSSNQRKVAGLPPSQNQPPPQEKENPVNRARHHIARNRSLNVIGLKAALSLIHEAEEWHRKTYPADQNWSMHPQMQASVYASMLYGTSASGVTDDLPYDLSFSPKEGGAK